MSNIAKIDKNFQTEDLVQLKDVEYFDVKLNTWCLFGLNVDSVYRRMPQPIADQVNDGVSALCTNTAGGRLRFKTDSPYIALYAQIPDKVDFPHMPQTGISGFDLYDGKKFVKTFIPPIEFQGSVSGVHEFGNVKEREITIHFPLYNNVSNLHIGLKKGSSFSKPNSYRYPHRIVYYGSSITQGGCASRPGLAYPSQIANKLGIDFINLGFSGSAKGEQLLAEYIASLEPDIFVYDYDNNAPSPEYLAQTHEPFFQMFRKLRKTTPVIFMSAPNVIMGSPQWQVRREIIRQTYRNAVLCGDNNVFFIDGAALWGEEDGDLCTMDRIHPNDLGFYRMANAVLPVIQKIVENS